MSARRIEDNNHGQFNELNETNKDEAPITGQS